MLSFGPISDVNKAEAATLLGMIDSGERHFFENGEADAYFGGWYQRLFYRDENYKGVFISCDYAGVLRVDIAFTPDIPACLDELIIWLLNEARAQLSGKAYIWCRNENRRLIALLRKKLDLADEMYASYEMVMNRDAYFVDERPILPPGWHIEPYSAAFLDDYLDLLEKAMTRVSPPNTYLNSKEALGRQWQELGNQNAFHSLFVGEEMAALCFRKGAEIDHLAVTPGHQRKGAGRLLLDYALRGIFDEGHEQAYLYCVDENESALQFYRNAGMRINAHSARLVWESAQ